MRLARSGTPILRILIFWHTVIRSSGRRLATRPSIYRHLRKLSNWGSQTRSGYGSKTLTLASTKLECDIACLIGISPPPMPGNIGRNLSRGSNALVMILICLASPILSSRAPLKISFILSMSNIWTRLSGIVNSGKITSFRAAVLKFAGMHQRFPSWYKRSLQDGGSPFYRGFSQVNVVVLGHFFSCWFHKQIDYLDWPLWWLWAVV